MADDKNLKQGDRVEWETSQGKTTGKVKRRVTDPIKIKGHKVKASKDDPQYVVESEKSGNEAAHKPGALKKKG
jgi:Hypervirulence associated proteins TUDOR domain